MITFPVLLPSPPLSCLHFQETVSTWWILSLRPFQSPLFVSACSAEGCTAGTLPCHPFRHPFSLKLCLFHSSDDQRCTQFLRPETGQSHSSPPTFLTILILYSMGLALKPIVPSLLTRRVCSQCTNAPDLSMVYLHRRLHWSTDNWNQVNGHLGLLIHF